SESDRKMLFEIDRISMMYLPRICNHCVNPGCVAACPSGALYKRGDDGIVLINQDKCRGWRACISACPYKKIYFNWKTGKSEKCILCYPRIETGQVSACFHSCVGRIRYMGVLLYDADRIQETMSAVDSSLIDAGRSAILDPFNPEVIEAAEKNGISSQFILSAQKSPVWKMVCKWKIALPLHPEFRTLPMLYYVPPMIPIMGRSQNEIYNHSSEELFAKIEQARIPLQYFATLFSAGNMEIITNVMKRLLAVRYCMRFKEVKDVAADKLLRLLRESGLTMEEAVEIYKLTAISTVHERYVMPPIQREQTIEDVSGTRTEECRGNCGLGNVAVPKRGL
ncbi:MAG: 4Fe-4S dicluster domain-containing protein, partial [Pseudomonadota bacterium]